MGAHNYRVTLHMPLGDFTALLSAPDDATALAEAKAFAHMMMASSFTLMTPACAPLVAGSPHVAPAARPTQENAHA